MLRFNWTAWRQEFLNVEFFVNCISRIILHIIVAIFNPFDTFGDQYGSINMLSGRLSTGKLNLTFSSPEPTPSSTWDTVKVLLVIEVIFLLKVRSLEIQTKIHHLDIDLELDDSVRGLNVPFGDASSAPANTPATADGNLFYQLILTKFLNYLSLLKINVASMRVTVNRLITLLASNIEGAVHFQDMQEQHMLSIGQLSLVCNTSASGSLGANSLLSMDSILYSRRKVGTILQYERICLNVALLENAEVLCSIQNLLSLTFLFSQYSSAFYISKLESHQAELYEAIRHNSKQYVCRSFEYCEEEGLFYYDAIAPQMNNASAVFPDSDPVEYSSIALTGVFLCVICSSSDTDNGLYEIFEVHRVSLELQPDANDLTVGSIAINHRSSVVDGSVLEANEDIFSLNTRRCENDIQIVTAFLRPLQLRMSTKTVLNFLSLQSILLPHLQCIDKVVAAKNIQELLDGDHPVSKRNTFQYRCSFQVSQVAFLLHDDSHQADVSLSMGTLLLAPLEEKAVGHSFQIESLRVDCQAQPILAVENITGVQVLTSGDNVKESIMVESVALNLTLPSVSSLSKITSAIQPSSVDETRVGRYNSVWKALSLDVTTCMSRSIIVQKSQLRCKYSSLHDVYCTNPQAEEVAYELLIPDAFEMQQNVLGNWTEDTRITFSSEVSLLCTKADPSTNVATVGKVLLKMVATENEIHRYGDDDNQTGMSQKPCARVSIINSWAECFYSRRIAVGYNLSIVGLEIGSVSVLCDVQDLQPLLRIINEYNVHTFKPSLSAPTHYSHTRIDTMLQSPSSLFKLRVNKAHVTLEHRFKPVVFLTVQDVAMDNVSFSDCIYQHSMSLRNLVLSELSADYAVHKTVLSSVDSANAKCNTISSHYTIVNEDSAQPVDFLYSGGVYDVFVENLRFIYLQRATLTLVCYIRDYLIKDVYGTLYRAIPSSPGIDYRTKCKGIFRLGIRLSCSEVHLPNNSCAMEALVIFFKHLDVYRLNDVYSESSSLVKYCQGPMISKDVFLSDSAHCDIFYNRMVTYADTLFNKQVYLQYLRQSVLNDLFYWEINNVNVIENIMESRVEWNVLKHVDDMALKGDAKLPLFSANQSYLMIELHDAMIASYCNDNPICEHQEISCKFHIYQVTPYDGSQCTNARIYDFIDNENDKDSLRNTMIVAIEARDIDWVLSQGQYWAIVNLIQQNFCELQEHVEDPWALPDPKCVTIDENSYGKFALSKYLPIINSVPIVINKGRITTIFNEALYYSRFISPAPAPPIFDVDQAHNIHYELPDTIPRVDHIINMRQRCHNNWKVNHDVYHVFQDEGTSVEPFFSPDEEEEVDSTPFCVLFEDLYVDFYRKHFGGGNGIEVYANSFIVLGIDDNCINALADSGNKSGVASSANNLPINEFSSYNTRNLKAVKQLFDEVNIRNVVLAPKDSYYFALSKDSQGIKSSSAVASGYHDSLESPITGNDEKKNDVVPSIETRKINLNEYQAHHLYPPQYPHGIYSYKPESGSAYTKSPPLHYSQQGVQNLRRCHVTVHESVIVAHFHSIMSIVKFFNHPVRVAGDRNEAVLLEKYKQEFDYKAGLDVEVHCDHTVAFLPNFPDATSPAPPAAVVNNDARASKGFAQSLSSNSIVHDCPGLGIQLNLAYTQAWRGFLQSGPGSERSLISARILNMFIAPLYECNVEDSISLVEQLQFEFFVDYFIYPTEEKFYTNVALCRPYIQFGDWISSKINKLDHPSGSRLMRVTMKKVINSDPDEKASRSRSSSVSSLSNHNKQDSGEKDEDKANETDDEGAESDRDIHSKFSLKDVDFILSAITHLRTSIRQQILSIPKQDPYSSISKHIDDMRAVPDLKYWLICTFLDKGLHTDVKELSSVIDNFDVTLHNNTYNLNILNVNISEICLAYSRSLEHLHIASGVFAHISTYNDSLDIWEPVLEPLHVNAIGATDATTIAENKYIGLTTSKIRVEVTTDRVECNASQYAITNLIHKLQLNDVVTSSSNRLPPYKIYNQLGVDVYFNIGYNGGIVINNVVSVDSSLPIEISQLVSALNNYKMRKLYHNNTGVGASSSVSHSKEYLLWISFINFRDIYESRVPLSIDKVGTNLFDMMKANRKQHEQHHRQSLLAADISDDLGSTKSATGQPIKFVSEMPLTLLHMSINANGIRELFIRSILSIKNHTNRVMYVSVKFYGSSTEDILAPGKVYQVPVRYAHPKASLCVKFVEDGVYYEAMSSLGGFIAQGPWGNPLKLRAHLCLCPYDESKAARPVSNRYNVNSAAFMFMLKPEVKHGSILSQSKTHVPVKYPGKENYVKLAGASVSANNSINCSSSGIAANAKVHITHNILALKPFVIHIQAPLLFCNLLPIPMLYKLASDSNILCAEGCLLPGQTIDIYNLSAMYNNRLYISIRVVNYTWSKWYLLCTRSSPYHHTEKHSDITLKPMQFRPLNHHSSADCIPINLPTLDIAITQREFLVRFSCQIILNNACNTSLYLAESAYPDNFLILQQNATAGIGQEQQSTAASSALVRSTSTGYSPNDVIPTQDDNDEEDTPLTAATTASTPFLSSNTVDIQVYLPHDHVKCISVPVLSDLTVNQVFHAIKDQLSCGGTFVNIQDYLLFYYQANKGMQNNVLADAIADTADDEVGVVDNQSATSTSSTPPRGIFRSRSGSRSSDKSSKSVDKSSDSGGLPLNMKYNMSIELSGESSAISSSTYVYALLSYDIVIVHKAEHTIYTQSKNITAETSVEGSTGIFNTMFGKSVKVQHLTSFVPYNSAIPYKPHRMLSFHAHVCVKDHITSDWSNSFDLVKTDYDVGDMIVLVKSKHLPEQYKPLHAHTAFYELGTYVEKGRGLLQHSTMITFVPKRTLISKLAYAIYIKQISNEAEFELAPGGISHFHFVDKTKFPLLHARREQDGIFCGELDISRLGLVYVKLRLSTGSICILKVETELIGASFISTFTEQSLIWPPYRIYNNTSLVIRFKQSLDALVSAGNIATSNLAGSHNDEGQIADIPFDTLKPKQSVGYAWDFPHSGSKLIKLEILPQNISVNNPNSTSAHVAKDINVYNLYNSSTSETMVIKKTVPNIGNPLAEGHLMLQQGVDTFLKVYCILRTDIMYVYEDDSRNILINIIHFSHTVDSSIRYAMVGKYEDSARPQLMGFLNNIISGSSNTSKYLQNLQYYDVNHVRILMLTLANYMQLFSSLTLELLNKKFARKESESDAGSVNDGVGEESVTIECGHRGDAVVNPVTSVTNIFNHEESVPAELSIADEESDTAIKSEPEINTPVAIHLPKNLHSFLADGIGVEQLLDEISGKPVFLNDIMTSLLDCNIVENEEEAILLCECWIAHGFLVKASGVAITEEEPDDLDKSVDTVSAPTVNSTSDNTDENSTVDAPRKESSDANESEDDDVDEGFGDDGKDKSDVAVSSERRQSLNYRKEVTKLLADALKKRYLSAMSGKQNRPVTKTSRLIDEYLTEELYFRPPALCPELAAAMQQHDNNTGSESADAFVEEDLFGFSLIIPGFKYNFRCASEMEYLGWLQACRQSVELAWKEIILGNKSISNLSVEDFQATVNIKVRADGSTKVIEIIENESSFKKAPQTKGKPHKRSSTSSLLMPLLNRGKRLLRQAGSANSAVEEWSVDAVDKDSELLAVSFSVKAVSISVIDTAPQEILYLGLNDIHMSVVRYFDAVQFSVTVRNIQVSNQLLNPTFPVLLFARRLKETQSGKLMLPGLSTDLYSDTYTFPTLHLYLKQRYHSINPETGLPLVTDNDQNHQKLWYFDLFTLWLAPLQLAVDEEIIMRVIRYAWGIRNAVMKKPANSKSLKDTVGTVSLQSSKFLQTELDYRDISQYHKQFLQAATTSFDAYAYRVKKALNLYFGLLQLHPLDITLNFRPSPEVQISNAELAAMSIISQLDAARLCLNALIAENAFGSTTIISEIVVKHYRASFWRQFHKLIGATDIVEGSVGLVANIGTGFYDLFYEPIDGLLDSNSSFLNGLSKGGKSLASRAIGGTSAFTSTITGGIGKGVSLLTLDSDFQRNRSLRRFNKTTSVSEGLMVGTQELGKNIMEGVTGIVVAPYKGWESGGGVGLGVGIAKGILGVALKPAVGVFDLASRATEGIRNAAFSSTSDIIVEMKGTYRTRVPRAFGRFGVLLAYDAHAAAAQYMVDSLAGFKPDPRLQVIAHLYLVRKISEDLKNKYHDFSDKNREMSKRRDSNILAILDEGEISKNVQESWGMGVEKQYLIVVGNDRIVLMEILDSSHDDANANSSNTPTSGQKKKKAASNYRRFVWSCPAQYIDQLYCDNRGDLVLTLSHALHISSPWSSPFPTVLDLQMQNYTLMQSLLEQTVGVKQARLQPLHPWTGFTQSHVRKRYNSGIRSYLLAPTYHTYRLFGSVLYEYSSVSTNKSSVPSGATQSNSVDQPSQTVTVSSSMDSEAVLNSAEFAEKLIKRLFDPVQAKRRDERSNARRQALLAKLRAQRLVDEDNEVEEIDRVEQDAIAIQEQQVRQSLEMLVIDDNKSEVSSVEKVDSGDESEEVTFPSSLLDADSDAEENVKVLHSSLSAPHGLETIAESEQEEACENGQEDQDLNSTKVDILRLSGSGDENSVLDLNAIRRVDKVDSDDEEEDEIHRKAMYDDSLEDNEDTDGMLLPQDIPQEILKQMQQSHRDSYSATPPTLHPALTPYLMQEEIPDNMFLSFVYPLVDLYISGPHIEDNGKQFSIMLARIDGQKMRVLRREDEQGLFAEYKKNSLSLLFDSMDNALRWRHAIEQRIILRAPDALPTGFLTTEERKKATRTMLPIVGGKTGESSPVIENSILSSLVLPTSDVDPELAELIKIEIARTISETKR